MEARLQTVHYGVKIDSWANIYKHVRLDRRLIYLLRLLSRREVVRRFEKPKLDGSKQWCYYKKCICIFIANNATYSVGLSVEWWHIVWALCVEGVYWSPEREIILWSCMKRNWKPKIVRQEKVVFLTFWT